MDGGTAAGFKFALHARVEHVRRGPGIVVELMADGRTRIFFDNGEEHKYKVSSMHKIYPFIPEVASADDDERVVGSSSSTPPPLGGGPITPPVTTGPDGGLVLAPPGETALYC